MVRDYAIERTRATALGLSRDQLAEALQVEGYEVAVWESETHVINNDWGVHFEFDDQINGTYNCVQSCRLTRSSIEVLLLRPIDRQKKYETVCAEISELDDASFVRIHDGLPRIFRGSEDLLRVETL